MSIFFIYIDFNKSLIQNRAPLKYAETIYSYKLQNSSILQ